MQRNGHKRSRLPTYERDALLFDMEMRETQTQLALHQLEIRRRALENTLARFRQLYQHSPVGFITFDNVGRVIDANRAAEQLLQISGPTLTGLSMSALVVRKSSTKFMEHLRLSRASLGAPVTTELEMLPRDGTPVAVQLVTSAVLLDKGRIFETAIINLTSQKAAEAIVKRALDYAESIVDTIPYPLIVLDARKRVVSANSPFYTLFKTSPQQVVNVFISELQDVTWTTHDFEGLLNDVLREGQSIDGIVVRAELRNGSHLALTLKARRLARNSAVVREEYLLIGFEDITRRKRAEDERELLLSELQESQVRLESRVEERTRELGQSYKQLRDVGEQLVLAHESEQRRIARELHDQIGQDLTALKITLSRGKNGDTDEMKKTLLEAGALTDELLQTVRNICGTLRPQVLDDLGLVAGLQWHVKTFSARAELDVTFDIADVIDETRLTPIAKSTIFRVIQEALTNISRHAETKTASVVLTMRNGSVDFSVRDGGKGFELREVVKRNSTGISSMRERLSLVKGKFEIVSSPGQGTTINASIPLPHNTAPHQPEEKEKRTNHGKRTANQNRSGRRSSPGAQGTQIPARQ